MILQLCVISAGVINGSHAFKAQHKLRGHMEWYYLIKGPSILPEFTLNTH